MIQIDKTQFRNLEEQVQFLTNYHDVNQALIAWGIRIVGIKETADELPTDYTGEYGDAYAVGTAAPYDFYIWTRAAISGGSPYWFPFGQISLVGPQGPQGPKGDKGDTGASTQWFSGSDNPSLSYPADTHVGDFYLKNDGTVFKCISFSGVLGGFIWQEFTNIKGPQGLQGPRGLQGDKGDTGETGPQGPRGDVGGLVNIRGIVSNIQQLPTPESLENLTVAYLVGTQEPYNLYIQIGETPETAMWEDVGPLNTATLVFVNGEAQNIWDADTKVDKTNKTSILYGTETGTGNQKDIPYSTLATGNTISYRDAGGRLRSSAPLGNDATEVVNFGYLDTHAFLMDDMGPGRIPIRSYSDVKSSLQYSPNLVVNSVMTRDSYGRSKVEDAFAQNSLSFDGNYITNMNTLFKYAPVEVIMYKDTISANSYKYVKLPTPKATCYITITVDKKVNIGSTSTTTDGFLNARGIINITKIPTANQYTNYYTYWDEDLTQPIYRMISTTSVLNNILIKNKNTESVNITVRVEYIGNTGKTSELSTTP